MKGFKDFLMRGNLVELAVAFVIGSAFAALVKLLVESIFNPIIGALFKADSLDNSLILTIGTAQLKFGAFIGGVINFVIVAAVVYFFVVLPYNKVAARFKKEEEKAPEITDVQVLQEIRDILKKNA